MTLLNKISDKLTGNSSKNVNSDTTTAPGHGESSTLQGAGSTTGSTGYANQGTSSSTGQSSLGQNNSGLGSSTSGTGYGTSSSTSGVGSTGTGSSSTGYGTEQRHKGVAEKAKEVVGLDPKDGRDPKDAGYGTSSTTSGTSSSYGTSSGTSGVGSTGTGTGYGTEQRHKGIGEKAKEAVGLDPKDGRDPKDAGYSTSSGGIDRQSERLGGMSLGSSDPIGDRSNTREVHTSAPIVQERYHDQYEHVDKTRVEELHDRTEVKQTVQPVFDERTESTQRERKDHGLEVHEHGKAGLDSRTEAELAAKREALAAEHRNTHDETTTNRSMRPDVDVIERTNVVEEVVPVLERDIYRPHEITHEKRVVNIHHEKPVIVGTRVEQAISLSEWEAKNGNLSTTSSGITGRQRRDGSSSSSSSDEEYTTADGTTGRRKKGLGEKLKEKVGLDPKDGRDPKDAGYATGSSSSTTGTSSSYGTSGTSGVGSTGTSSGYGTEQRHKGIGEKAKETVGLDPKDGRDPKDAGYATGSSSSSTGYGNTSTGISGDRVDQTGGRSGTGLTGTGSNTTTDSSEFGVDGQRKKGFGEKIKEAVGLDPKDPARDPKDQAFNANTAR